MTSTRPGGLVKISVAVAVSDAALEAAAPLTQDQLLSLVSAAVGANDDRGDTVQVVVSAFESTEMAPLPFYEEPWFAMALRYGSALIAILLVLFLIVRPVMKRMTVSGPEDAGTAAENAALSQNESGPRALMADKSFGDLPQQVELARQLAASQPERAVEALQRMLEPPAQTGEGVAAR